MFHNFASIIVFGKIGERSRLKWRIWVFRILGQISADQVHVLQISVLGIIGLMSLLFV